MGTNRATENPLRPGSLVLYKQGPARVRSVGEKLELELEQGRSQRVRAKDVSMLHPGPLASLNELEMVSGEVEAAWELLAGETTSIAELADLAFGGYTPATAWAAWRLVSDQLYFSGTPEAVTARTAEEVQRLRAEREARQAQEQAWGGFLARVQAGSLAPEDTAFLRDVEEQAMGRRERSRLLEALGKPQSREVAHGLLLKLGHWDALVDPHPARLGVSLKPLDTPLPPLARESRVDLTHLEAYAIDDESTGDPDDALSVEGGRLWVHVADAAAMIGPDTEADVEARSRGATLYLPETIAPMLPPAAVERIGLGLAEVSPALSFGLGFGEDGGIKGMELVPSWVRARRITYAEADERLAEEPFATLDRLATAFRARRDENGAAFIELPEVKITAGDGRVAIAPVAPHRSRVLVAEAMLMAGEACARFALQRGIPFPFTTQDPPDMLPGGEGLARMYALRRSMKPRQQSTVPGAHSGLGLGLYAQVTSPLRRYLDLVAHQQLAACLSGHGLMDAEAMVARVGAAEAAANAVRRAERLARAHWTIVYLMQEPDWRGTGVVVDKRDRKATVLLPELAFEAKVKVPGDPPLNTELTLRFAGGSLPELEAYFRVEGPGSAAGGP